MRLLRQRLDDWKRHCFARTFVGCGKDALSGFEWASPASASALASAVAFCRQAAWRQGAIGCRTRSSRFRSWMETVEHGH